MKRSLRAVGMLCFLSFTTPAAAECAWIVWEQMLGRQFGLVPQSELWRPVSSRQLDLIHCVDPFQRQPVWGEPAYFRLHGKGGYHYRYSDAELDELLGFCRGRRSAYVLFNNTEMWGDARRFLRLLAME